MLKSVGADIFAGIKEVGVQLGRFTIAAIKNLAISLWNLTKQAPRLTPLVLMIGPVILWAIIGLLILNIRFAATVLPDTEVDLWNINRTASLTVYDRHGELIGVRGSRFGERVALDELPPFVIDAFIATEDRRFYDHHGFDLRGLARAMIANMQAGSVVQGGSTITQQLAKNLFLVSDRTLLRKLEEIQLALWMEAHLSKEEILSLYLNRIYLGAGAYGIEAAADTYFSKPATELTLSEAALIAGLPKAPSTLAPTSNMEGALKRSHEVLDNLVEAEMLHPERADLAKHRKPELVVQEWHDAHGYFLDYIVADLQKRFGELSDDLIVETTLDANLQVLAHDAVNEVLSEEVREKGAEQAGLIAFDDQGGVIAMVGGRDYLESQFNRAAQAKRQPGSAFKPFVFLAALESGLSPETVLVDQPVSVDDWSPRNYTGKYRGPMRLATAVARSTNSIAVQVTEGIGRDRVIDAAHRAGIDQHMDPIPSLALGAVEMTLEDLTAAYLPFAHSGSEVAAHAIDTVRTRSDDVLYEFTSIEGFRVIEPQMADDTTRMLMRVMTNGTGRGAQLAKHESAGKTGTTNEWRDAWFVGFTHYITAGVWVGNDDSTPMEEITGSSLPLDIWKKFMTTAHADKSPRRLLQNRDPVLEDVSRLENFYGNLRIELASAAEYGPMIGEPVEILPPEPPVIREEPRRRRRFPWFGRRRDSEDNQPTRVVGRPAQNSGEERD